MSKLLIYLPFLLIIFASCEEYYTPKIDTIDGLLVVDAQITNDLSKSYVHLSKTRDFYSKLDPQVVSVATVELVQINGPVIQAYENGQGNYIFPSSPVVGKNYKLRITISRDIYESDVVAMPPLPSITAFYTEHKVEKQYRTDATGSPTAIEVQGREIYVDAPVTSTLSHYRFVSSAVMEWVYTPPQVAGPPPPQIYGWNTFYFNSQFNIAAPKIYSQSNKIEMQPLFMLSYSTYDYLQTDTVVQKGWILTVDEFGTSAGSFDFHQKLNSQFAADGSLFDPVQTQIFGNINCKSDPSKIVFGYFDLNSYRQYRYFLTLGGALNTGAPRQLFKYPYIPFSGTTQGFPPSWWE